VRSRPVGNHEAVGRSRMAVLRPVWPLGSLGTTRAGAPAR
jgi:hypothetical protein